MCHSLMMREKLDRQLDIFHKVEKNAQDRHTIQMRNKKQLGKFSLCGKLYRYDDMIQYAN